MTRCGGTQSFAKRSFTLSTWPKLERKNARSPSSSRGRSKRVHIPGGVVDGVLSHSILDEGVRARLKQQLCRIEMPARHSVLQRGHTARVMRVGRVDINAVHYHGA